MESKAKLVEDPATTHGHQSRFNHFQGLCISGSSPGAEQEKEVVRGGKFWCFSKSTILRIKALFQIVKTGIQDPCIQRGSCRLSGDSLQMSGYLVGCISDLVSFMSPHPANFGQNIDKT